jgi:uncharacterized membrane protein
MLDSERKWAISCYIPVFNVVMCALTSVRKVGSKFCLFHARQGLALFALWIFTILVALISQTLSLMLWGVVILLHATGAFIAFGGKMTEIPVLGQLAMKIPEHYLFELLAGKKPEVKSENVPEIKPEVNPDNPSDNTTNVQNK